MTKSFATCLLLAILGSSAAGQTPVGAPLPAVAWTKWLAGEPVAFGEAGPACSVWAWYPAGAWQLAADADYLVDVQRRFADRGVRVVAIVPGAEAVGVERWQGCGAVTAPDAVAEAWDLGHGDGQGYVVVADRDGVLAFRGRPEAGLVDAIEHALAGDTSAEREQHAAALRIDLPQGFDDVVGKDAAAALEPALAHAPRDGLLFGLRYLALATKSNDADKAAGVLQQAIEQLDKEARPLATFADLALRGDPGRPGLAKKLLAPLQTAAALAPNDPDVQLAFLRALVLGGSEKLVGRVAARVAKLVSGSAAGCLAFATILTRAQKPAEHVELANAALRRAAELGATPRLLTAARYGVALRCAADPAAAKQALDGYLEGTEMRISINNDCWYFLTQLPTMGSYDWFACGLAERMLEQRRDMDYFEFDTAALAMFLVGRVEQAVELQETALHQGGGANPEYAERLERYRGRLPAAPR